MNKFESLEQLNSLIHSAEGRGLRNINFFLSPQSARELISQGRLLYADSQNALGIFEKYDRYMVASFFSREAGVPNIKAAKPVVTSLPFIEGRKPFAAEFELALKNSGFEFSQTAARMSLKREQPLPAPAHRVELMTPTDADAVFDIWEENFDATKNLLYSRKELAELKNPILVLKGEGGEIFGAVECAMAGKTAWLEKIAIKKQLQHRSLGGYLEACFIEFCKARGATKICLFTANERAEAFHSRHGFERDGRGVCQYILKEI